MTSYSQLFKQKKNANKIKKKSKFPFVMNDLINQMKSFQVAEEGTSMTEANKGGNGSTNTSSRKRVIQVDLQKEV